MDRRKNWMLRLLVDKTKIYIYFEKFFSYNKSLAWKERLFRQIQLSKYWRQQQERSNSNLRNEQNTGKNYSWLLLDSFRLHTIDETKQKCG